MTVPCAVPPDAHFWKPLPAEDEIAFPAGTRLRLGEFGLKCNPKLHVRAGRNRLWQVEVYDGLVVLISIVRRDLLHLSVKISLADSLKILDVLRAILFFVPLVIGNVAAALDFG